jgi:hypothetical protein
MHPIRSSLLHRKSACAILTDRGATAPPRLYRFDTATRNRPVATSRTPDEDTARTARDHAERPKKGTRVAKSVHTRQSSAGRTTERRPRPEPVAGPSPLVEAAYADTRPADGEAPRVRPLPPGVAVPLVGLLGRPARRGDRSRPPSGARGRRRARTATPARRGLTPVRPRAAQRGAPHTPPGRAPHLLDAGGPTPAPPPLGDSRIRRPQISGLQDRPIRPSVTQR